MRKLLIVLSLLVGLSAPVHAQDYVACQLAGKVGTCPGNVRLKGVSTLALANIPTMDVAHLPIVTEAKAGFGADVSGLGTGYLKRIGAATWTAASIPAGDLPSGIDPLKIGAGLVSNTVFGYIANLTSDAQAQLALKLDASSAKLPPAPSAAGGTLYDSGSAWLRLPAGTANYLYQANGASSPAWVNSLTGIAISGSTNSLTNLDAGQLINSIADARLSANVDLLNTAQTIAARKTFPVAGANAALIPAILGGPAGTSGHAVPNVADDTFGLIAAAQSFWNKTYVAPVFSGSATGNYTLAGFPTLGASVTTTDNTYNVGDTTHRLAQLGAISILSGASALNLTSNVADGSSAIGVRIYNTTALANVTGKIVSWGSNGVEKGAVLSTGGVIAPTAGPVANQQHVLPAVTSDTVALLAAAQAFTNKSVDGGLNTLSNINPSSLTNTGTAGTYAVPMSITTTSKGLVSAVMAGAAPLTATLSGTFSITHTDGATFDNTGVSLSLTAGTWVIVQQVRSIITTTTLGGQILTRLFDATNSVEVTSGGTGGGGAGATNSSRLQGAFATTTNNTQGSATGIVIYTVTGNVTIRLDAVATVASTTKTLNTDVNGATNIVAWQVR